MRPLYLYKISRRGCITSHKRFGEARYVYAREHADKICAMLTANNYPKYVYYWTHK